MMSEVNVLWSSAWRNLQKNLASAVGADGAWTGPMFEASVQGSALRPSSWLVRARSLKEQGSRMIQ
jgi:hypothetical protein